MYFEGVVWVHACLSPEQVTPAHVLREKYSAHLLIKIFLKNILIFLRASPRSKEKVKHCFNFYQKILQLNFY